MAIASTTSLVDALRQYRLLEPVQMEEVSRSLQERFPDPKELARELIQRGWLTPFQVNQSFQGHGQELLLGSYVLLERVGEGGMGQVFKAKNWKLGRIVAVKLIRKDRLHNPAIIKRFQREVRAAAALSHPNIVRAFDADEIAGTHLLVMEYIEGAIDLSSLVKKNGPLPVDRACEFIRQAALGLQHACERGLVHRDIKPANLLLTADGKVVKILDMGLARLDQPATVEEKSTTLTREGVIMGTPDYISPEQALESHTVDIRADIYSLGCTVYYLLTGRAPFAGGTLMEKLLKHRLEEPTAVEKIRSDVPPGVVSLVRKLMAKRPEDRYQMPAEVALTLETEFRTDPAISLATSVADQTMAEKRRPVPGQRDDTVAAAFAYMAKGGDTLTVDDPHRQQPNPELRPKVFYGILAGAGVLVAAVVLFFLLNKESDEQSPALKNEAAKKKKRPAVRNTSPKKHPPGVDDAWFKQVARMPAEKQVEAVAAKLKKLNPDFNGTVTHKIENGMVTDLGFWTDNVTNISPVRALVGLKNLSCAATVAGKGKLADLSPLKGMQLTSLACPGTRVRDLSPLKGMKLTFLACYQTDVADLSPLKGMPLTNLQCGGSQIADLSPLKGMPLTHLSCNYSRVSDLSPLKNMKKLSALACYATQVSDLSPLKGVPLAQLNCHNTSVSDLSPLKGMPLTYLHCDFNPERDTEILRSIKTLKTINGKPAKEFWKRVDEKRK